MRQQRKREIGELIEQLVEALHPDRHGLITIEWYVTLRNRGLEAVQELRSDKDIR